MKNEKAMPKPPGEPPRDPGEITIEFVDHDEPPSRVDGGEGLVDVVGAEDPAPLDVEVEAAEGGDDGTADARVAELEDQILRLRAEFANFRRRVDRDRSEYLRHAKGEAVTALLPVLDDLDRAVGALEPGVPEHFAQGLVLLRQKMLEALRGLGLEEIEAEGAAFDPNLHEAVSAVHLGDVPPMTVTKSFTRGYTLGGKVLKPARVEVNRGADEDPEGERHG